MIAIVASRHDIEAHELATRWKSHGAALLTCEDLATSGWQHSVGSDGPAFAVVSHQSVPQDSIRGVLVRRPWVFPQELVFIEETDREFVSAEMNAFLISWLSSLNCPVLNRPRGACLCGPDWQPQQWAQAAARAGFRLFSTRWRFPHARMIQAPRKNGREGKPIEVLVVGDRCIGAPNESSAEPMRRLAKIADTDLLNINLLIQDDTPIFVSATAIPRLGDREINDAVLAYLLLARPRV